MALTGRVPARLSRSIVRRWLKERVPIRLCWYCYTAFLRRRFRGWLQPFYTKLFVDVSIGVICEYIAAPPKSFLLRSQGGVTYEGLLNTIKLLQLTGVRATVNPYALSKISPVCSRRPFPLPSLQAPFLTYSQLPGYGHSTPSTTGNDKLTYSHAIAEALHATFGTPIRVLLIGHDRGARVFHRLAVSRALFPSLTIAGVILADIIPTYEQFAAFSNPAAATRYFHWAFLPVLSLSVPMITAFGGGKFCRMLMQAGAGANAAGAERLFANGSLDVYAASFERESVVEAAARDYEAAATVDYAAQVEDQQAGRKIEVPTLVLYSTRNLGAMGDVPAVWKRWVAQGTRLEVKGVEDGYGHFFIEEAPELVGELIIKFAESVST